MPLTITLRPARPDERGALEALQRRASTVSETYRDLLLAHPEVIELPLAQIEAGRVSVADAPSGIAGFCVVIPATADEAELDGIFVEPRLWRHGVGRALLGEAERAALRHGASWLTVVANPEAKAFYESTGFTLMGKVETRFDTALAMRKKLK